MFLTAVFTMLTPLCARTNVYLLVAVRILEGLFEVMIFVHSFILDQIKRMRYSFE